MRCLPDLEMSVFVVTPGVEIYTHGLGTRLGFAHLKRSGIAFCDSVVGRGCSESSSRCRVVRSGESTAWTAAWSIVMLVMGVSLEIHRIVSEELGPNTFIGSLGHFAASEIYSIVIMSPSIIMAITS